MGPYVDAFHEFTSIMPFLGISLVYREQNKVADRLAAFSSSLNVVIFLLRHVSEYVLFSIRTYLIS